MKYIFGPVPSRRLGNIIGLDIIPIKTCTFDCIYCELGRTKNRTLERARFFDPDAIIDETINFIRQYKGDIDYIAFTGSGEPSLNADMGVIARTVKSRTKIPLALVTNSSLMGDPHVREEAMAFDVVLPSLDAFNGEMAAKINRPAENFRFNEMIEGLKLFSNEFTGLIYLEIMFVKGFNDSDRNILELRRILSGMRIDKIQVNTVTRSPAYDYAEPIEENDIARIINIIGDMADAEGVFTTSIDSGIVNEAMVMELLKSRPLKYESISRELGVSLDQLRPVIARLQKKRSVLLENIGGDFYYSIRDKNE